MSIERYQLIIFPKNNKYRFTNKGWEIEGLESMDKEIIKNILNNDEFELDSSYRSILDNDDLYYYYQKESMMIEIALRVSNTRISQISLQISISNKKNVFSKILSISKNINEKIPISILDIQLKRIVSFNNIDGFSGSIQKFNEKKIMAMNILELDEHFFSEPVGCGHRFYQYLRDNESRRLTSHEKWSDNRKKNGYIVRDKYMKNYKCQEVYLNLNNEFFYIGTGDFVYSFFDSIWILYANKYGNWGENSKILMKNLYSGKVGFNQVCNLLCELEIIERIFKSISIKDKIWLEKRSYDSQFEESDNEKVYTMFNINNGSNLLEIIRRVALLSIETKQDILVEYRTNKKSMISSESL